jgi:predicted extracellular nuclease
MGRQVSSFGTDAVTNRTVTTSGSVTSGERIFVNATGGALTLTLPSAPNDGDTIQIIDVAGIFATNNVTINRNGQKIQNLAENLILDMNNAAVTMIFSGATFGWVFIGP